MAKIEKVPTAEFHSGYGCIIMTAVVAVVAFIVWWSWYSLVTMDKEIGLLTQSTSVVMPQVAPQPGLEQRLADFAKAANAGQTVALTLTVAELNVLLLLAPDGGNGTYKDMLRVKSLDAAKSLIVTDASLPMNTAKFWEDTKRYLVGEIDFTLEMTTLGPDAKVSAVRMPGKTVPEGMLKGMQMYGYLGPYQAHPTIGPVLKAIKQVRIETDGLRLSTEP
jgi:hypothetical protein